MSGSRVFDSKLAIGQRDIPVSKEITVYRNGDSKDRPITFLYNNRKFKDWDHLMDTIDGMIKPKYEGNLECLYTPRGTRKVDNLEDLDGTFQDNFVACGKEGYVDVKGGYERLKDLPPDSDDETDEKIRASQEFRKAHPVRRIYLRQEHEEARKAKAYLVSTRRKDHQDMDGLIEALNKQFKLDDGDKIKYIWTEDGTEIENPDELFVKQCYVMTAHRDEKPRSKKDKKKKKSSRKHKESEDEDEDEYEYDYEDDEDEEYASDKGSSSSKSSKKKSSSARRKSKSRERPKSKDRPKSREKW